MADKKKPVKVEEHTRTKPDSTDPKKTVKVEEHKRSKPKK